MKIVFLDIDGVLNSWRYYRDLVHAGGTADPWPDRHIDPKPVKHLNRLLADGGAKVVVSSTWRNMLTLDELRRLLGARGFEGEIVDRTPDLSQDPAYEGRRQRGWEIGSWLLGRDVDGFVILDDGTDMVHLAHRHVLIDAKKGLKPRHIEAALALLGGQP